MRDALRVGREVVPTVLVALLVCHLIRAHLLEWYLVPSSSMEPTLHGDPEHGDLVLVDKTAFWWRVPRRFDMVVLRNPDDPPHGHVVKRLIAWGGDERSVVRIHDGDVFLGRSRQDLARHVKDPCAAAAMRLVHFAFPEIGKREVTDYFHRSPWWSVDRGAPGPRLTLASGGQDLDGLAALLALDRHRQRRSGSPPDFYLPGHLSTRLPVDATFLNGQGRRWGGGLQLHRDIGMEIEVEIEEGCTGLQIVFEYLDRYWALQYGTDGQNRLFAPGANIVATSRGPALEAGRPVALTFGYLDGWFFALAGGELLLHVEHELPESRPPGFGAPGMHNLLHLGVAGAPVVIRRLSVFHDVYYKSLQAPFGEAPGAIELQPGELFLLGDNTFDSRDSRTGRTFARSDLVGRPVAVIGPPARMRWLTH